MDANGKATTEVGREDKKKETIFDIISDANKLSCMSHISSERCIFKVPDILRRHGENAYKPIAFSIGPLHYGRDHLKATEKIKMHYLQALITRKPNPTPQKTLENLIKVAREMEEKARECYAVSLDHLSEKDFTACLVLDGCFIIELLRKTPNERVLPPGGEKDPVFSTACMVESLLSDLKLLENQIPWFVLDRLFNDTSEPGEMSLTQLAIRYFATSFSTIPLTVVNPHTNHATGCKHILDLLRATLVSSCQIGHFPSTGTTGKKNIPSATKLKEAGIKFKSGTSGNILNINFKNGVLEIPTLRIAESTNALLRNLVSFEQCYPKCSTVFTSYAKLLNNLINTRDDIIILQEEKIIDNWLTPDDSLIFFNKLYEDTFLEDYYQGLCSQVNDYIQRWWPKWRAAYIQNHFAKPWVIVSEVIAGIALLLTLCQTIFTIRK